LVAYYLVLVIVGERSGDGNSRHATLLNLGSQTAERSGAVADDGSNLVVGADGATASATWDSYSYQIVHLMHEASSCTMSAAIVGADLTSPDERGSADVLVNGATIEHIAFSAALRGAYPFAAARLVPARVLPQRIDLVALDSRYGVLVPIPARYCAADSLSIGVRVHDATWKISHAGIVIAYTPALFSPLRGATLLVIGLAVVALGLACLYAVLRRMSAIGLTTLVVTTVILALAPLAYDQWDFRIWESFGEFAVFGAGDPAYLWYGSPLWTFVPSLFSAVTAAWFLVSGHGAASSSAILMKIGMGLAYCYSAYQIAIRAPQKHRVRYALLALLVPTGLYELAGGYRELFATAIAIASIVAVTRRRFVFATILAVVAASIAEEFLPLVFLPAAALLAGGRLRTRLTTAVALAIAGAALFVAEWQLLIPHDFAAAALQYRFGPAPLGSASWAGALDALGFLPTWLPVHSPLFGAILLLALAAVPGIRLLRILLSSTPTERDDDVERIVGLFIAFVAAFLLAFRGTDPNLWYSLLALTMWYFAASNPRSTFPLILGSIEGLSFYATVGLRDFVNHAFFWPIDVGLFGTLSTTRYIFDLMANALILTLLVSLSSRRFENLISETSSQVWLIFVLATLTTATESLGPDIVILAAAAALVGFSLSSSGRLTLRLPTAGVTSPVQGIRIVALAGLGALYGTRSAVAAFYACFACVLVAWKRLTAVDTVLLAGAIGVIGVQTGVGWVSSCGLVAFLVLLLRMTF
jgi:hypothetical protein